MRVLFLYTELASYFIKCCEELAKSGEVHIIRWPVNKEAPFDFEFGENIKVYDKESYTSAQLIELARQINPTIVICSGWIDKDYLKIVKQFDKKIPTVLTCDTQWRGTIKQRIAILLSRVFLLDRFTNAWVPGASQKKYVSKLGFKKDKISLGFYSCDLDKFNSEYELRVQQTKNNKPLRFLYVGRYYEFKGVKDLWQAFIELQKELPNSAELWCLGTGDIQAIEHPGIKHFGFVQPNELGPIIQQCSVFVLPSHFEPWGVVVQEYAASGFPLLLSSSVGAANTFLQDGINGYSFSAQNINELKQALKKMLELTDKEVNSMAAKSHELAQLYSPKTWAATVKELNYGRQTK